MNRPFVALLAILAISPAYADGHHGHGHRHGGGHYEVWGWQNWIVPTIIGGAIVYGLTQPQPGAQPQPVYIQPQQGIGPAPNQYWYFCTDSNTYYPYVSSCPSGWQAVLATPPATAPDMPGDAPTR